MDGKYYIMWLEASYNALKCEMIQVSINAYSERYVMCAKASKECKYYWNLN